MVKLCKLIGLPTTTFYRWVNPPQRRGVRIAHKDRAYPNRLKPECIARIIEIISDPANARLSVRNLFYQYLDAGEYAASVRSFQRVLASIKPGLKRTPVWAKPVARKRPVLKAAGVHQVWSWDITLVKLAGSKRWLHVYVVMDLFSRKIVGFRVENNESGELAADMLKNAFLSEDAIPKVLHSDNGSAMKSRVLREFLSDYGVSASFSRPQVSNDNPYSESLFRTLKTDLDYPKTFTDLNHARQWVTQWVHRHNTEHYHTGLAGLTATQVVEGKQDEILAKREATIAAYYRANPHQKRKQTHLPKPKPVVWINKPNDPQNENTNLTQTA